MERNWVIWEQDKLCQRIYKVKLDDQAVSAQRIRVCWEIRTLIATLVWMPIIYRLAGMFDERCERGRHMSAIV